MELTLKMPAQSPGVMLPPFWPCWYPNVIIWVTNETSLPPSLSACTALPRISCCSKKNVFRLFTTQADTSVSVTLTSLLNTFLKCSVKTCLLQNEKCEGPAVAAWDVFHHICLFPHRTELQPLVVEELIQLTLTWLRAGADPKPYPQSVAALKYKKVMQNHQTSTTSWEASYPCSFFQFSYSGSIHCFMRWCLQILL